MEKRFEELLNTLEALLKRFEKALTRQEIAQLMENLMVLQLDARLKVGEDTLKFYLEALSGEKRKVAAFRRHVMERYFRK